MKLLAQLKTPGLGRTLSVTVRLRWPDAVMLCVETEGGLVEAARDADVILLDAMSTRPSGFELIRRLRAAFDGAIIVFAHKADDEEMLSSLEAGADDYLSSSAGSPQLVARLSAVLRRLAVASSRGPSVKQFGSLKINEHTHEVYFGECEVRLSPTEFVLLSELSGARGAVLANEALHALVGNYPQSLWGECLRKHIERLRKKLSAAGDDTVQIVNVRGVGYRLKHLG